MDITLTPKQRSLTLHLRRRLNLRDKYDFNAIQREVRAIKEYSLQHMDSLLEETVESLEDVGCSVYVASSYEDACDYALEFFRDDELIVKSKSNAAKEIGVVSALLQAGKDIIETDLGDRIVQLLGLDAMHPLAPAIHVPKEDVARAMSAELGKKIPPDVELMVKEYSRWLLEYILKADGSITGANSIAAREGAIALIENEGNISLITRAVKKHLVVAYTTKIVPHVKDALTVVQANSLFGAGQPLGTYLSFISGPSKTADVEGVIVKGMHGPSDVSVLLVKPPVLPISDLKDVGYCLNCGICLSVCPVYYSLDQFGGKYGHGGIGIVKAFIHGNVGEELWKCTGCKACESVCPSMIDSGKMIHSIRKYLRTTENNSD